MLDAIEGKSMKIGIFCGSFNPIHIGHLALANYICEYEGIDEVWFMVTPHNPLKNEDGLMDDELRLNLVRIAIDGYSRFVASDFEFKLPRPSYTVNTLDHLKEFYPMHEFLLIIGADNWINFKQWKESERILAQNKILVYPRPGYPVSAETIPSNVKLLFSPVFEISSSFIRQALKENIDIRYFLHPGVYKYLLECPSCK